MCSELVPPHISFSPAVAGPIHSSLFPYTFYYRWEFQCKCHTHAHDLHRIYRQGLHFSAFIMDIFCEVNTYNYQLNFNEHFISNFPRIFYGYCVSQIMLVAMTHVPPPWATDNMRKTGKTEANREINSGHI